MVRHKSYLLGRNTTSIQPHTHIQSAASKPTLEKKDNLKLNVC